MNQLLSNPSRLLFHHCLCPTALQIVFFLFSGSNMPGPGSHQDSVFVGPSPAMFLLTINLRVFGPFLPSKHSLDFSSSERHSQTTQLVWPLSLTLSHCSDLCSLYDIIFLLTFISIEFELQRTVVLLYLGLGHKKKVALILMHFENVLFSTEHVYLVMH